jgi:hypothetical protein
MAKGMESNVSDDESDTTSLNDLVELIHEQKGMLEQQANEFDPSTMLFLMLPQIYSHDLVEEVHSLLPPSAYI